MLVRLYTGDDGQSHFEDLDLDTWPAEWSLELPNARINFARRGGPGYPFRDWHNEGRRQYLIILSGQMEVTVGDGAVRVLDVGDVMLAEDLTGQGHKIRSLGDEPYLRIAIPAGEE